MESLTGGELALLLLWLRGMAPLLWLLLLWLLLLFLLLAFSWSLISLSVLPPFLSLLSLLSATLPRPSPVLAPPVLLAAALPVLGWK